MDDTTRAMTFEPLFTTKPAGCGSGLGLPVVQRIVQALGGVIRFDSAPGAGSCFHVYLPLAGMPDAAVAGEAGPPGWADKGAIGQGQHVIYIDDDEAMSLLASSQFPRSGLRVSCFEDAEQALAALRASPEGFDVLVTDFNMPRLSGLDVARAVRDVRPGLPVIITSGNLSDDLIVGAREAGVSGLVNKERTFEDLGAETLRVLARPVA